jgi:hypothetical protein
VVPFYGEVCDAMRFQQLYPQPDLNVAGRIVSVAVYDWGDLQGYFYDAHVRLCATRTNQLASEFHANYGGNEPTVVFSNPSLRVANGQSQTWFPFVCSAPFFYLNRDNLLVEVTWHGDNGHNVGLYKTGTGGGGRVWANSDSATIGQGEPSENMYARVGFLPFRLTGSLLSPNGGETWPGESSRVFVWTVTPKNFQFGRLLLSTDNGATFPTVLVSSVLPTDTAHAVALPQVNSDRCRARFEAFDSTEEPALVAESESSFTIDSDEPSSPILAFPPSGGAMNSQSITFRWHQAYDSLSGVAHYTIQVAYDSAFATLVDTARRTDTSYART